MNNFQDKVAVITGAASGIGRALAVILAKQGCLLALCDKDQDGLDETSQMIEVLGHQPLVSNFDVTDRYALIDFAENVNERFNKVDVLINNAGVTIGTKPFLEITEEEWQWIIDINIWGVIYGTQAFLPYMVDQKESCIVNLSSMLGLAGMTNQAAYSTTKFAVRGLSESLRMELAEAGVNVIAVFPGAVRTNIVDNAWADDENKVLVKSYIKKIGSISADDAAHQIVNGIKKKKPRVVIGSDARKVDFITRLMPNKYTKLFLAEMKRKLE